MWAELIAWGRQFFLRPESELAGPDDLLIPQRVDSAQEAIALVRRRYGEWLREPADVSLSDSKE